MSDIHTAVAAGDLARVKSATRSGISLDARDSEGRTPLHLSILEVEDDAIALELLRAGADPEQRYYSTNVEDNGGLNALHLAACKARTAIIRAILDLDIVDIDAMGSGTWFTAPPLLLAITSFIHDGVLPVPCVDGALALLEAGADTDVTNQYNANILHFCASLWGGGTKEERLTVMRAALERGAAMDTFYDFDDPFQMQPLHIALLHHFHEAARLLIESGAPLNDAAPGFSPTPLMIAPHSGSYELFELMMQCGGDIYALNGKDRNFLHYCVEYTPPFRPDAVPAIQKMLRVALERGVNVHQACGEMYTRRRTGLVPIAGLQPLHDASESGTAWAVAPLVEAGADVNARDRDGFTPLMTACVDCAPERLLEIVKAVLSAGGDVHARTEVEKYGGHTSLELVFDRYGRWEHTVDQGHLRSAGLAIAALVAAGDRRLAFIPSPCPGLETALAAVWRDAKDDLPAIFERLEPSVQARVRTTLLAFHRLSQSYDIPEDLRWTILDDVLA